MGNFQATKNYPFWLKGTVILFGLTLLFVVLSYGRFILMPLALSALLAMLLEPLCRWLEKLRIGRALSIILSMIVVFLILGGIISLLSIQLVQFASDLSEAGQKLQQLSNDILSFFQQTFGLAPQQQVEFLQSGLQNVIERSG